jgi:hypothetical protein
METELDALGTAQNVFGSAKHENWTRRPRYRPKWVREHKKDENKIRRPRYRPKWVRERKTCKRNPTPLVPSKMSSGAQNMKTGRGALGTAQNESGSTKHENGTRRPR